MRSVMEKLGFAGIAAALLALLLGIIVVAGAVGGALLGFILGPFIGIVEGVLAVANSNVNLTDWYNHGAQITTMDSCVDPGSDIVTNIFGKACHVGAAQGVEYWNQALSYRAVRIVLPYALGALCTLAIGVATARIAQKLKQASAD